MFPISDDDSARRTLPVVTYALIALNILVFFIELNGGDTFIKQPDYPGVSAVLPQTPATTCD